MTEGFQFNFLARNSRTNLLDFNRSQFTRKNNPTESELHGGPDSVEVVNRKLGRGVHSQIREISFADARKTRVLNNDGMNANVFKRGKGFNKSRKLGVFNENVEGDEYLHPVPVRNRHQFSKVFGREILCAGAGIEGFESQKNRIRAGVESRKKLFAAACGCKDLRNDCRGGVGVQSAGHNFSSEETAQNMRAAK